MPIIKKDPDGSSNRYKLDITYTVYIDYPTAECMEKMNFLNYWGGLDVCIGFDQVIYDRLPDTPKEAIHTKYDIEINNSIIDPGRKFVIKYNIKLDNATEDEYARLNPHKDYPGDGLVETFFWRLDKQVEKALGIRWHDNYRSSYNSLVETLS